MQLSAAAALTAVLCFLLRSKWRWMHAACIIFLSAAAAFAGFWLYWDRNVTPVLELSGKTVVIEGLITETDRGPSATSYTVKATFADYPALPKSVPVIIRSIGEIEYKQGDAVRLRARVSAAPDSLWYRSRGILLTGQNARDIQSSAIKEHRVERMILRFRDMLARNIYARLSGQNADIVAAMTLGMKNNIAPEIYAAVGRSGTAHLLSISGLHLSILAAFALALLKKLRCPKALSALTTILVCFLFAAAVGFGASVFRSFVMTAIALSGRMFSRRGDSLTSLGLALLICSIARPNWAVSWGLWLSAGSTLGIILFGGKLARIFHDRLATGGGLSDRILKGVANAGAVSVAAYAFTLPVLLLMSGWISIISPFANILVAPFIPFVILGGIACALIPGEVVPVKIIAWLTDFSTSIVVRISEILARLPFATIAIDESYLLIWLFALCVFTVILIIYRGDKKLVSYALVLSLISFSAGDLSLNGGNKNKLELVTFASHNAAVLLRGNEAVILGTPDLYEISNLLKYLNFRGVRGIPAVIAADCGDRVGSGLLRLSNAYPVDCVIAPNDAFIASMLEEALPQSLVYSGGYAEITVLGGAIISTGLQDDSIYINAGKNQIVKMREQYGIMEFKEPESADIRIYNDGVMLLPQNVPPAFEPVGAHLFGESRVLLKVASAKAAA